MMAARRNLKSYRKTEETTSRSLKKPFAVCEHMGRREKAGRSVCYANPTLLLRRPISELLAQQEGKRRLGLLIPAKGAAHEKKLHHTELFKKVEVLTYPAWHPPGPFEWPIPVLRFFKRGWKTLSEYDVVHCWAHFYPSTLLLMLKALLHSKTKVILTMDTLPGYSFSTGKWMDLAFRLYTWTLGRIVYQVPDVITLYGKALLPHARKSGIDMRKVKVIPTGIMPHKLPSKRAARQKIMKEFKLKERIVLYAGLINPRKRVTDVLDVAERMPGTVFLVAGDGPSMKRLKKESRERQLSNVHFLGWRKDLLVLMRAADALLFPSGAEGLPGVVMEAMYCGTPVVTTRISCTTDLITHEEHGLLCEVGDVDALAVSVERILHNKTLAQRLVRTAKQRITNEYSWKRILPEYERLYG